MGLVAVGCLLHLPSLTTMGDVEQMFPVDLNGSKGADDDDAGYDGHVMLSGGLQRPEPEHGRVLAGA